VARVPPSRHRHAASGGAQPPGPQQWLVHCTRDRILVARRQADGDVALVKIYETGTLEEAAREVELAPVAAGVVRYRSAGIDPPTARPCVTMDFHPGVSLEAWIARHGPLSPIAAAGVIRGLAAILARVHGTPSALAPDGVVHCDVKPGNVLCVGEIPDPRSGELVLLDFEHAWPRARTAAAGLARSFTGGTHGYAPPEAYRGAVPTPAFDVFGLGATLQLLATGREAFPGHDPEAIARAVRDGDRCTRHFGVLPAELRGLIADCLDREARERPSLADLDARLGAFLARRADGESHADLAMRAAWSGEVDEANRQLAAATDADADRVAALRDLIARRRRLLARAGPLRGALAPGPSLQALADGLAEVATRAAAWIARFPCHEVALRLRREVVGDIDRMLREVGPTVTQHKRSAQFDAARRLVEAALSAATTAAAFPGRMPEDVRAEAIPGPLQRDPVRFLQSALDDVRRAARVHDELCGRLQSAEAQLDPAAAQKILDAAAGLYSGANDVVAGLKDRQHRFGFYLEAIARAEPQLAALREQGEAVGAAIDLRALHALSERCRQSTALEPESVDGGNLRLLSHTLRDLVEEFPHAREAVAEGLACLERTTAAFTERCWEMLADAGRMLGAEPVPIRPLQTLLNRIDRVRMLDVVVDRPQRTRAELLDELERTRLRVERARATRDRLARGAQAAMERGHLTTALYEMERAVDQFDGSGDSEPQRQQLVEQIRVVRERKDALEASAATARRLEQRYAELRDDPESSFADRNQILEERRTALRFLIDNLQEDRAVPYRDDLRELGVLALQERAERAERRLDRTDDARQRLQIARDTLAEIQRTIASEGADPAAIGRVQRIVTHWQNHAARAAQSLASTPATPRGSRRRGIVLGLVLGALLIAGYLLGRCAT
jgi:hypothetical protein